MWKAATVGCAAAVAVVGAVVARSTGKKEASVPKETGVVYLYQMHRRSDAEEGVGTRAPNVSPFCIKVEAFLRLHHIPYRVEYPSQPQSRSQRFPYIELNGKVIEDSHFIIQHLKKEFNITDSSLSDEQEAVATMLRRTLDLSAYHCCMRWLFVDHFDYVQKISVMPMPPGMIRTMILKYIRKQIIETLNRIGNGDLDNEQYHTEWLADVKVVEEALKKNGEKKWFGGDVPNEVDCVVYSFACNWINSLDQSLYDPPAMKYARESDRIVSFVQAFEGLAFPDMDDLLLKTKGEPEAYNLQ